MSITISANSRTVGGLFSSMNSNLVNNSRGNAFSGMGMVGGFSYSDYASIRNGSYHKLLNSYYSLDRVDMDSDTKSSAGSKAAGSTKRTYNYWSPTGTISRTYDTSLPTSKPLQDTSTSKGNTSTSKEPASKLATVESDSEKLTDAADVLLTQGSKSVFNKVTTTDKDGNKTTGYNTDAIYKAVSSYVKQYNSLVKSTEGSNVMAIRASAASMTDYTKKNAEALSAIGIQINEKDKTLSIDEEAFKKADMQDVKALFQGSNSYLYQVSAKASQINYHAQYEAQKANTYNSVGAYSYNYSAGSLWNGMI